MKITRFYTLFLYMAVLLFASCSEETVMGPQGETGATGPIGPQGIPGKDGALILFGNGTPAESFGKDGDMYLDQAGSELYGPKTDSGWGTPLQLTGQKGDQGDAGAPGSQFLSGAVDPSTGEGAEGDYFLNQESGDLLVPRQLPDGAPPSISRAPPMWWPVLGWIGKHGTVRIHISERQHIMFQRQY